MQFKSERLALFLLSASLPTPSRFVFSLLQQQQQHNQHRSRAASTSSAFASAAAKSRFQIGAAAVATRSTPTTTVTTARDPSQHFCAMADGDFSSRSVDQAVLSRNQANAMGGLLRRSIGDDCLRNFDPFLLLDEFDASPPAGFPDHPHRGFETVTYMLKGITEHEDFCGHRGKIVPGSLQWMTAGRGIVHSEMLSGQDRGLGLQLWVNLKSRDKMVEPAYQELDKGEIPTVTKDGVTAIVIAGESFGTSSPIYTRTPTHYIHFKMKPNSELKQPIPSTMNSFLYMLEGKAAVGDGQDEKGQIDAHNTITLTKEGSGVTVKTFDSPANFVLISGEPTNEPIVQHGPFVMNTHQEIQQAMMDYQSNSNGFENAANWYSEIGLPLTDADKGRR